MSRLINKPEEKEFGLCHDQSQKPALCFGSKPLIAVDELKIKGSHNLQNALAALALGQHHLRYLVLGQGHVVEDLVSGVAAL